MAPRAPSTTERRHPTQRDPKIRFTKEDIERKRDEIVAERGAEARKKLRSLLANKTGDLGTAGTSSDFDVLDEANIRAALVDIGADLLRTHKELTAWKQAMKEELTDLDLGRVLRLLRRRPC